MSKLQIINNKLTPKEQHFQTIVRRNQHNKLFLRKRRERIKEGKKIENIVIEYFQICGLHVYESSQYDDMYNKIDMYLRLNRQIYKCQIKSRIQDTRHNDPIVETMRNITFKNIQEYNIQRLLNGRDIIKDVDLYIIYNINSIIILETDRIKQISICYTIELLKLYKYYLKYKRFYTIENKRYDFKNNKRVILTLKGSEGLCILLHDKDRLKINFFANIDSTQYIKIVKDVKLIKYR